MKARRVAFVVQRCGREVNGGAELACLEVAREMAQRWDVEIVTTCALDYMTWEDHYPPGIDRIDGVPVRRFAVDAPRDVANFNRLSERVRHAGASLNREEAERWMRAQGPYSSTLVRYLSGHGAEYDAVIFYTYLYATTYFGLPLVAERAVLAPFAHDEWTIHLPLWDRFFQLPQQTLFSTIEEREFLRQRFPAAGLEGPVVGVGIRAPAHVDPPDFRRRFGITAPYVLYVGRIDPMKGCEQLLRDFARYKELYGDDLELVLIGRQVMPLDPQPGVKVLGFVDEATKYAAIAACAVLVMPSSFESLSLVLLEAWSQGRPTLSNAQSDVLVGQSRRSGAGLWYANTEEFVAAVKLLRDPAIAAPLGARGKAFVAENYAWSEIARTYESVVENVVARRDALTGDDVDVAAVTVEPRNPLLHEG